jgi:hypothetical protein
MKAAAHYALSTARASLEFQCEDTKEFSKSYRAKIKNIIQLRSDEE